MIISVRLQPITAKELIEEVTPATCVEHAGIHTS